MSDEKQLREDAERYVNETPSIFMMRARTEVIDVVAHALCEDRKGRDSLDKNLSTCTTGQEPGIIICKQCGSPTAFVMPDSLEADLVALPKNIGMRVYKDADSDKWNCEAVDRDGAYHIFDESDSPRAAVEAALKEVKP